MNQKALSWLVAGTCVALALLVANLVWTLRNTRQLHEDAEWVNHTYLVILGLQNVLSLAKDAETGQRGFLLTGEPRYLEPYNAAVKTVRPDVDVLERLTADNPRQQARILDLRDRLEVRLQLLEQTIELRKSEGFDAARRRILTDRGKRAMDRLRAIVDEMIADEQSLLRVRSQKSVQAYQSAMVTELLSGLVGLAAVVALLVLVRRHLKLRGQAESIIAEQAERLRTTLASIGDAVITTDTRGRITNLNAVAETLTGWTSADVAGQSLDAVFRIVNEETRKPVENPAAKALAEGIIVGLANHTVLIAKDGTERAIDDSAAPIRCKEGEVVGCVLVFRDITERRQRESALRESEARKAAILHSALDCIITIDHDGKIIEFNPAAELTFGYRRDDVLGEEMAELIVPPSLRQLHYRGLAHYLATGEGPVLSKRIEMPAMRADGTEFPIELAITAIRRDGPPIFTAYLRDITASKRTETRRAARLAVTQILADAATVREAAPRILQAICESLGWDSGALWQPDQNAKVLHCVETWHQPEARIAEFEAATRQCTFSPGLGLPGRIWTSGQPVWIPDVVKDPNFPRAPIADREGLHAAFGFPVVIGSEFLGVIEFFSHEIREPDADLLEMMTTIGSQVGQFIERKQADENLRRVAADLSEADRRKNEFLAMLAHELRNPLAPIRNALQIMRIAESSGTAVQSASEMMERQMGQLVRLVDDLLDVSRISRGTIDLRQERVELASVVDQAVESSRPAIKCARHELTVTLPPQPVYLDADPVRLGQVFSNLLNNACKYTEPGGRISLAAERQGSDVVVAIKDTGVGIPADMLPHVFEMFAQVDRSLERSQGGLGIGLTLVQRLVEMHGGSVSAQSEGVGRGSEFIVRLPVMLESSKLLPSEPAAGEPVSVTARRILVVDDNRDSATSLAMLLRMTGNETHTAFDGIEAVEAAATFRPEVVLLDIGLPKLNGYEVARKIRDQPWGTTIALVALTGWGQDEDRRKSSEAGFDAHLVKPVDHADLKRLLAELLKKPV